MPIKHFYKFQNFSKKYLASSTLDNTSEPESKKTIDVLREAFAEQNHPLVQEFFNLLSLDSSLWKKKEVPTDLSRRRKKNLKGSYKPYSEAQLSYLYTDGMVLSNHSMEINGKKYKIIFRFGLRIIPTVYFDCVRNIDKDAHRTETLPPGYFANANVDRFTFQEGNNKEIKISYQSVSPTLEYVEEEPTLKSTLGVFSLIPIDSDLNI